MQWGSWLTALYYFVISYLQNGLYITIGIAASTSTLAATFLSLHVLIPIITRLGLDQNPEFIAQNLNVTNRHER